MADTKVKATIKAMATLIKADIADPAEGEGTGVVEVRNRRSLQRLFSNFCLKV